MAIKQSATLPHENAMTKNKRYEPDRSQKLIQQLQSLNQRLLINRARERKYVSTFLADTVVQSLSALHIQLSLLATLPYEPVQAQLTDSLDLLVDLIEEATSFARQQRPHELETLPLSDLLQDMSEGFSQLNQLPVHYQADDFSFMSEENNLAFYRFTQEVLQNIVKHAQASQVWVDLHGDETTLYLTIRDNGRGFNQESDLTESIDAPGLGLLELMLHFEQLDGRIMIYSMPNEGTTVTAVLPR